MTHGGFGYAKEYHVERLLREVTITRIAPITEQMILSFIAEKVLDLPKSYGRAGRRDRAASRGVGEIGEESRAGDAG